MRAVTGQRVLLLLAAAGAIAGCSQELEQGHRFERKGEYQYAYDSYYRVLETDRRNGTATAGMRRSIPPAVAFWEHQAEEAAAANQWQRAAQCHFKVLQIKPDEAKSIEAIRQIAGKHPAEVELAGAEPTFLEPPEEKTLAVDVARHDEIEDVGTVPLDEEPPARSPPKRPPGEGRTEEPAKGRYGPVVAAPMTEKKPEGKRFRAVGPGPTTRPAPARKQPPSPPPSFDPFRQIPAVSHDELASSSDFLFVVCLSENGRLYSSSTVLRGGLGVNMKGTDDDPDSADLELRLNDKKIGRYKKLTRNSVITAAAVNGQLYEVVVLDVSDKAHSVTLGLRECP